MSVPGCSDAMFTGAITAVTRGAGVSVVVRSVCNVDNIGSSMSVPGLSGNVFIGSTTAFVGTRVDDGVFVAVRRDCNVDTMGFNISVAGCS